MSRSLKKGPFVDPKLLAKVAKQKSGWRYDQNLVARIGNLAGNGGIYVWRA